MRRLLVLAIVGFAAQLIDGSLGMAYGVTSTTLLLASGLAPAVASASVHLAEVGTTAASGAAHWRFGNVDWATVRRIAGPGALGAFAGALLLSSLSTEAAAPWMAAVLLALGAWVLVRFTVAPPPQRRQAPLGSRFLAPLGLVAGFVDATGGGGWGPVATPSLLASGRMEPRKVIGSVDTSEFVVAVAASVGFLFGLGTAGVQAGIVLVLLGGGLVAAPIAAFVVRRVPARLLGAGVGGFIVVINARVILDALGVGPARNVVYAVLLAVWAAAFTVAVAGHRRATDADRHEQAAEPAPHALAPSP